MLLRLTQSKGELETGVLFLERFANMIFAYKEISVFKYSDVPLLPSKGLSFVISKKKNILEFFTCFHVL